MSVALQIDGDFGEICSGICLLLAYQPELLPHVLLFGDSGAFACAEEETQLYMVFNHILIFHVPL